MLVRLILFKPDEVEHSNGIVSAHSVWLLNCISSANFVHDDLTGESMSIDVLFNDVVERLFLDASVVDVNVLIIGKIIEILMSKLQHIIL